MLHRGRRREGALPEPLRALDEGVSVGRHVGGQTPQHRDAPSTPDWSIVIMGASYWPAHLLISHDVYSVADDHLCVLGGGDIIRPRDS